MAAIAKKYDLDLSKMGDEELVVLAQECGFRPAADELVVRFHDWKNRFIAFQARSVHLSSADLEDAQQNAVFSVLEAISGYKTPEMVRPGGCSFRSFLKIVLGARFRDFTKHLKRVERHYDRSSRAGRGLEEEDVARNKVQEPHAWLEKSNDPAEVVAWQEALARLHTVLENLDESVLRLWKALAAGVHLRQIAQDLGISYDSAKRQRRRLLAELASRLGDARE
jgi:RNA polymerase sigma factor (sigma-70 family)